MKYEYSGFLCYSIKIYYQDYIAPTYLVVCQYMFLSLCPLLSSLQVLVSISCCLLILAYLKPMYMGITNCLKRYILLHHLHTKSRNVLNPYPAFDQFCHFGQYTSFRSPVVKAPKSKIGIFWDLDNKPPNSFSPFEAAVELKKTVSSFGVVRYMVAYANRHAFSYVPPAVREQRMERRVLNHLEHKGVIKPVEPYLCRVCGRKFSVNEKLINHFKIHEREHQKRLSQIESAKGKRRVDLVGKYSMKLEKFKNAAQDILTPKVGHGLAEDLKRAGFYVKTVPDRPQAADVALRSDVVDMMDRRRMQCLVLVSDDSDFMGILKEARERCLKTVVVCDNDGAVLKRNADACFSWREILIGKAKKEVVSVVGQWRDRDILKRLEWSYNPEVERDARNRSDASDFENVQIEDEEFEKSTGEDDSCLCTKDERPWWDFDSDVDDGSSNPMT